MILVDSSVWIDFFNQTNTPQNLLLKRWLHSGDVTVGTADLVVFEVLRGFRQDKACLQAQRLLSELAVVEIGGIANALAAADHYCALRARGYTIRSPIDVLLASYCITHNHLLLHRDADSDVMAALSGLRVVAH